MYLMIHGYFSMVQFIMYFIQLIFAFIFFINVHFLYKNTDILQGRMQDVSGEPNYKNVGILDNHAAKRHVASSKAASCC